MGSTVPRATGCAKVDCVNCTAKCKHDIYTLLLMIYEIEFGHVDSIHHLFKVTNTLSIWNSHTLE